MTTEALTPATTTEADARRGFALALAAYLLWGLLPLYIKLVAHLPVLEVVAHRIIWSVPIAAAVLVWLGRTRDLMTAIRSPRMLGMAALTATLISINWSIYLWAIVANRAVEGALGYYINPLVNVVVGATLLGEKLDRLQIAAVALAAVAVTVLTIESGTLPWISLSLAFSFAAYGYFRKTLPIGPSQGFLLEVLLLSVPAIGYAIYLAVQGQGSFVANGASDTLLLLGSGAVTAIPLLLFSFGARLLKFSTIGMMQYIAPTMVFLIAVFVFHEPFGLHQAIAFGLIWTALALYSWSMFSGARRDKAKG